MSTPQEHEAGLVEFVVPAKRGRLLGFISNPRTRHKFVDDLWHFRDWDSESVVQLPSSRHKAEDVLVELTRRGARGDVHLGTRNLDGRSLALVDAIRAVVGSSSGTVVSCIPGRLAYFEGESPGDRCILQLRR